MNLKVKVRTETMKVLEENMDGKLFDIGLGDENFGFVIKAEAKKSRNKHMGLHKIKVFS